VGKQKKLFDQGGWPPPTKKLEGGGKARHHPIRGVGLGPSGGGAFYTLAESTYSGLGAPPTSQYTKLKKKKFHSTKKTHHKQKSPRAPLGQTTPWTRKQKTNSWD